MRTRWVPGYLTSFWVFWERFGDKELSKFWLQGREGKRQVLDGGHSSFAVKGQIFFVPGTFLHTAEDMQLSEAGWGQAQPCQWLSPTSISFTAPSPHLPARPDQSMILCNAVQERMFLDMGIRPNVDSQDALVLSPNGRTGQWSLQTLAWMMHWPGLQQPGTPKKTLNLRYHCPVSCSSSQSPGFSRQQARDGSMGKDCKCFECEVMQLASLAVRARVHRVLYPPPAYRYQWWGRWPS